MRKLAVAIALLAPLLAAQSPQPATAAAPDPLLTLYQTAKAAMGNVPAIVAPADWAAIGMQESIRYPETARDDLARAFRLALALPAARRDRTGEERFRYAMKYNIELEAVVALSHDPKGFALAHELARAADVPRYRLYTELIGAAENLALQKAGRRFPPEQGLLAYMNGGIGYPLVAVQPPRGVAPAYDVLALARECQQLDGSYPFLGILIALNSYHNDDVDQRPLLLLSYNAAADETDPIALDSATGVLMAGHKLYPDLDPQLESAATEMLQHLQEGAQHVPATGSAARDARAAGLASEEVAAGARVLDLLDQIDHNRAQELRMQFSLFSNPPHPRIVRISDLTAQQRSDNAGPETALSRIASMPTLSEPQKQAKFKAAMNLAISLARKNPRPAAVAADQALNLMDDALLAANYERVALLAARMHNDLHENAQAEALMQRCLDLAEASARSAEEAFDNAGADERGKLAADFQGPGAPEIETFTFASLMDPELALRRAAQTSAAYFKPLFLLRVALGEEMQHPWWE